MFESYFQPPDLYWPDPVEPDECPDCGAVIGDDVFCESCGAALDETEAAAVAKEESLELRAETIREEGRWPA